MKKISSLLVVLLLMLASFTAGLEFPRGDVDGDNRATIADVVELIDYLLDNASENFIISNADVDADGRVTIGDVTCLIDYLLKGTWDDEPVTPSDEHDWVDLGLPSGTLWATCNVGANSPEEYGDYFAWGETEPKNYYYWNTYKWCKGSYNTLTKYCSLSNYGYNGFTDGKTELDPEDDAAYVNWGSSWRMPTLEQQQELVEYCTWTWTQQNGVNGQLVIGPNGDTIFLPAAGDRLFESFRFTGSSGYYLPRTLGLISSYAVSIVSFNSGSVVWRAISGRDHGISGLSGKLVGAGVNPSESEKEEFFINDSPESASKTFDFGIERFCGGVG